MKSKQEVIQEAWGKYWDQVKNHVDKNGKLKYFRCWQIFGDGIKSDRNFYEHELQDKSLNLQNCTWDMAYYPKSLQGIETNNGWQETGYHHWRGVKLQKPPFKNGEYYEIGFMSATDNSFHNQGIKQFNNGFLDEGNYPLKPFPTHFKPISKSVNPLY